MENKNNNRGLTRRVINSIISRKVKDWLNGLPVELREKVRSKVIVTGGSIASMLLGEKVNDFDIYFTDKETVLDVAKYYLKKFCENPTKKFAGMYADAEGSANGIPIKIIDEDETDPTARVRLQIKSAGIVRVEGEGEEKYQYFEIQDDGTDATAYIEEIMKVSLDTGNKKDKEKYRPVWLSDNAITLTDEIQIILRFYGSANKIHENYDFVHCTNYWTYAAGLVVREDALVSLLSKELRYVGSKYPFASLVRIRKFLNRGFRINAGQIFKMVYQVSKLDFQDTKVLYEQMIGVDVAYFMEVLGILKRDKKEGKTIDETYLMNLIDKVF